MDKETIKSYELLYFQNGYDVPYDLIKGGTILIKPILVKDYNNYNLSCQVLDIKKNETNDSKIIQMSYLEFILNGILNGNEEYQTQLCMILSLCLGEEYVKIGEENNKKCLILCDEEDNVKGIIKKKEFDEIRKIILYQNDIEYDDRYISPDVKKIVEEYYSIKYKNTEIPSLEKRKAFVASKTGMKFEEINNMKYRFFSLVYESNINSEIYIGQKIIQASSKYEVKEDIQHPLYSKEKDKYEMAFVDEGGFKQKIGSVAQ